MFMLTGQPASINPVFAGHAAKQLREASDDLKRVFDNLLEIARGNDDGSNTYDRLRAAKTLYDRGFGKVAKNPPSAPAPESESAPKSAQSNNQTDHGSDTPEPTRPVAKLERKLEDSLGPPQAPAPQPTPMPAGAPIPNNVAPGFVPDLVRDAQHYVLEITDYGAELASILMDIHEPDPDDESIRTCHRITAGQMIIERVLGPAVNMDQAAGVAYDPNMDPHSLLRYPADIDPEFTLEELKEADRAAREFTRIMRNGYAEGDEQCESCEDGWLCEYHDPQSECYETPGLVEEDIAVMERYYRNSELIRDRLYKDTAEGGFKIRPRDYVNDT